MPQSQAMKFSTLVLVSCLTWTPAIAQSSELETDRPDQTESTGTIARGQYQIETGVLWSENDISNVNITKTEILGTLVRMGLTERIELRVGFDGFISRKVEGSTGFGIRDEGFGDSALGAKIRLSDPQADRPQMALLIESSIPTGESDLTSDSFEPSVRLAVSQDLNNRVALGGNIGIADESEDTVFFYTMVAGYDVNSTNGAFLELFGNSEDEHSIDTGWTHLVSPTTQWDLAVGIGITDEAPDWFAGMGITVRFPD
jgi:hypothetical protein